jgi:transposase-like protein
MTKRGALTQAEREYVDRRHRAGASLAVIAAELGCGWQTVRKWWRRQRRGQAVPIRGRPAQGILSTYPAELVQRAVELKATHPHWGPPNVKLELRRDERFSHSRLPSDARLSALFKARCPAAVQPHRRQLYPPPAPAAVRRPHQRWQIDGQEKVPFGSDQAATLLNVRDPAGALMIASRAILGTTPQGWRKPSRDEIKETLRDAFSHWGLPLEIQTDHEVVYTGAPGTDFPTTFSLWLVGLGLAHVTSRDRRPTDQAQVERGHRTLGDMSWKDQPSQTLAQLQALVDERRARYNQELPVRAAGCHGQPPLVAHPAARHSGRSFARAMEWELFELQRVDRYLAQFAWTRQVGTTGQVSLGGRAYFVGHAYDRQPVSVRFLPLTRAFRIELPNGSFIRQWPALGLEPVDLIGFMPLDEALLISLQLPLPWLGV